MSTTSRSHALPIAPILEGGPRLPLRTKPVDRRVAWISLLAVGLGVVGAALYRLLDALIRLITNACFFHQLSLSGLQPAQHHLGWWVLPVPVLGGAVVGIMARYGSRAIRGHGIPEAMEQVLTNHSRIPARVAVLKPVSAAVAIGTGGPFGMEGPIIASGGAIGSIIGQLLRTTPQERKTLLAAGAAAGMAATFGSPISAVLLAIELLLFEYRARSVIPVCLATATAAALRLTWAGTEPLFPIADPQFTHSGALLAYAAIGALVGIAAVLVTHLVYRIEEGFEKLPVHWMWWPALGGIVVGLVGWWDPRTLGVGYTNIADLLAGSVVLTGALTLLVSKGIAWSIALGSGTSGGTLAPLCTLGAALGLGLGHGVQWLWPSCGIDLRLAALVGMAALFAGASRALLASIIFAWEVTRVTAGILPLLTGCAIAYFLASWHSRTSIMTERIARRGVGVGDGFTAHPLDRVRVGSRCSRQVVTFTSEDTVGTVRAQVAARALRHQAFPIVAADGHPLGMLTQRDLVGARDDVPLRRLVRRGPVMVHEDHTLHEAVDLLLSEGVGRLLVVDRSAPNRLVGILTRSDILASLEMLAVERRIQEPALKMRLPGLVRSP